ncbi:coiled-coil domain-containing protein mad1 [Saitoella coloradoensis]
MFAGARPTAPAQPNLPPAFAAPQPPTSAASPTPASAPVLKDDLLYFSPVRFDPPGTGAPASGSDPFINAATPASSTARRAQMQLAAGESPRFLQATPARSLFGSAAGTPYSARRSVVGTPRKGDSESAELLVQLQKLQYELSNLQSESERSKLEFEAKERETQARALEETKKVNELETDKRFLFERSREQAAELDDLRAQLAQVKAETAKEAKTLREENSTMKEKVAHLDTQNHLLVESSQQELNAMHARVENYEAMNAQMREEMASLSETLTEKSNALAASEEKATILEERVKELESRGVDAEEMATVQRELSHKLDELRELEIVNRRQQTELDSLREKAQSIAVLTEEKSILETRLKQMEDLRERKAEAELKISELQRERAQWISFLEANEDIGGATPEAVCKALAEERGQRAIVLEKLGRVEAELNSQESKVGELEKELKEIKEELATKTAKWAVMDRIKLRLERQKALALQEAEFLRAQLKTYDDEESMFMQGSYDEQKAKRLADMEVMLADYKTELAKFISEDSENAAKAGLIDVDAIVTGAKRKREEDEDERLGELTRRNRQLQDDLAKLQQEDILLKKELTSLQAQIEELDKLAKVGQTRILQLKSNPTVNYHATRQEELDLLKAENASLLAQVEGRIEDCGNMVPAETLTLVRKEIKKMEAALKQSEIRTSRLKEVIGAKMQESREAVWNLLGYKMEFLPEGRVRLVSALAKDKQASIVINLDTGTLMRTGETSDEEWSQEMDALMTEWLAEKKTTPGFLAALTLKLFEVHQKKVQA